LEEPAVNCWSVISATPNNVLTQTRAKASPAGLADATPLVFDGLWALLFVDTDLPRGIADEQHGLFGRRSDAAPALPNMRGFCKRQAF
jgi:hypothetical protein